MTPTLADLLRQSIDRINEHLTAALLRGAPSEDREISNHVRDAHAFSISAKRLLAEIERFIKKKNEDRDRRILDMREEGKTYSQIARTLNISRSTVSGAVFRAAK